MGHFLRYVLAGISVMAGVSAVQAQQLESSEWQTTPDSHVSANIVSRAQSNLLTIKIKLSSPEIALSRCCFYDLNERCKRYALDIDPNSSSQEVGLPPRKYMFVFTFFDKKSSVPRLVVIPEVDMTEGDVTLEVSDAEATNLMSPKTILPDGQIASIPTYDVDEEEIKEAGTVKNGQTYFTLFRGNTCLYCVESASVDFRNNVSELDGTTIFNNGQFYVNDLPEEIQAASVQILTGLNNELYYIIHNFGKGVSESKEVTNSADSWLKIDPVYGDIPDCDAKPNDGPFYKSSFFVGYENCDVDGVGLSTTSRVTPSYCYISAPEFSETNPLELIVTVGKAWADNMKSQYMREFYPVVAPPVRIVDDKLRHHVYPFSDNGSIETWANREGGPEFFLGREFPSHPRFSWFDDEAVNPIFGNNVPVLAVNTIWTKNKTNCFFINSIGRLGEQRTSDRVFGNATVEINGEEVTSGSFTDLIQWSYRGLAKNPEAADWKITFKVDAILVDGQQSSNETVMTLRTEGDDYVAPTMTMLNFRDRDDRITDRFELAEDATLEFSAGDFVPNVTDNNDPWFGCQSLASVKVEYSAEGKDEWKEIAVEEVPELFYMPGYGHFYRGSLAGMGSTHTPTGWYDLRVTIADNSGNAQTQTLSPAVMISEGCSLERIDSDNAVGISVCGSEIRVSGVENPLVKICDLTGRELKSGRSTVIDASGLSGALIVSVYDGQMVNNYKIIL